MGRGKLWIPGQAQRTPHPRNKSHAQGPAPGEAGSLRIVICNKCQTIETLPAYKGDPDKDFLLHGLLQKHGHRELMLGGQNPEMSWGNVWIDDWNDEGKRRELIKTIRESEGHTGLGDEYYASHDFYREEAGKCFNRHSRNPNCPDYQDHSKLLGNTMVTDEEISDMAEDQRRSKRELRRQMSVQRGEVYLCHFCPVQSLVMQRDHDRQM